jgi:hypothetical protein
MTDLSTPEILKSLFGAPKTTSSAAAPQAPQAPVKKQPVEIKDLPVLLAAQAQKAYNPNMPPIPPGTGEQPAPSGPGGMPSPAQPNIKGPTGAQTKLGTSSAMDISDNWGNPQRIGSAGT